MIALGHAGQETMVDGSRFDALAKSLVGSGSRRHVLGGLLGGTFLLLGSSGAEDAGAHDPLRACRKIKNQQKRAACLRRARTHRRRAHCRSDADCPGCESCVTSGTSPLGTCIDLFDSPVCSRNKCETPVCHKATRTWRCVDRCPSVGAECCAGDCLATCPAGQSRRGKGSNVCTCCGTCDNPPTCHCIQENSSGEVVSIWCRSDITTEAACEQACPPGPGGFGGGVWTVARPDIGDCGMEPACHTDNAGHLFPC